jgi:hypothetical protein
MSISDFEKAVKERQADKGVRTLPAFDFFKQMVYGQLAGCCGLKSEVSGKQETLFWPTVRNCITPVCLS